MRSGQVCVPHLQTCDLSSDPSTPQASRPLQVPRLSGPASQSSRMSLPSPKAAVTGFCPQYRSQVRGLAGEALSALDPPQLPSPPGILLMPSGHLGPISPDSGPSYTAAYPERLGTWPKPSLTPTHPLHRCADWLLLRKCQQPLLLWNSNGRKSNFVVLTHEK